VVRSVNTFSTASRDNCLIPDSQPSRQPRLALRVFEIPRYTETEYVFVIVDLAKSEQYPQNFYGILPKYLKVTHLHRKKRPSRFVKEFGLVKGSEIAKALLTEALEQFKAHEGIRTEIERRLKQLKPKETIACLNCSKQFATYNVGYGRHKKFCSANCRIEFYQRKKNDISNTTN